MNTEIVPTSPSALEIAGQIANEYADRNIFAEFRAGLAQNTRERHIRDLGRFAEYLAEAGVQTGDLLNDPEAWRGVTHGIVKGFIQWALRRGFAIGTIGVMLSTVRKYASLAFTAGAISESEYGKIRMIEFGSKVGRRADEHREVKRTGSKKSEATVITREQAKTLKTQPPTAQGRRDAVLLGLLLTLGLRVGEAVTLTVGTVDLGRGLITFERPKVNKTQTHALVNGLAQAMREYIEKDLQEAGPDTPLLRSSVRGGRLDRAGMTRFGIAKRIQELGERIGIDHLSPHDLRHAWATLAAEAGTPIDRLMSAGGWSSYAMPLRYIRAAEVANDGIVLPE